MDRNSQSSFDGNAYGFSIVISAFGIALNTLSIVLYEKNYFNISMMISSFSMLINSIYSTSFNPSVPIEHVLQDISMLFLFFYGPFRCRLVFGPRINKTIVYGQCLFVVTFAAVFVKDAFVYKSNYNQSLIESTQWMGFLPGIVGAFVNLTGFLNLIKIMKTNPLIKVNKKQHLLFKLLTLIAVEILLVPFLAILILLDITFVNLFPMLISSYIGIFSASDFAIMIIKHLPENNVVVYLEDVFPKTVGQTLMSI